MSPMTWAIVFAFIQKTGIVGGDSMQGAGDRGSAGQAHLHPNSGTYRLNVWVITEAWKLIYHNYAVCNSSVTWDCLEWKNKNIC